MSSVVAAGHPGTKCSSSIRICLRTSGIVTNIVGLPNMKVLYIPIFPNLNYTEREHFLRIKNQLSYSERERERPCDEEIEEGIGTAGLEGAEEGVHGTQ